MKKTKIVIVDDHILIAKAISSMIEGLSDFEVLYESENGKELIEKFLIPKNIPEILLLDISMPLMDGFETAEWVRANHPEIKIMALTMQSDEKSLIKMFKAGATGYLSKTVHPADLEKALKEMATKGYHYPDWATNKVMHSLTKEENFTDLSVKLTDREREFLRYTCTELTYKEIAEKMGCGVRTVESFRDVLFDKLQVKTRVALALFAVKSGLFKL